MLREGLTCSGCESVRLFDAATPFAPGHDTMLANAPTPIVTSATTEHTPVTTTHLPVTVTAGHVPSLSSSTPVSKQTPVATGHIAGAVSHELSTGYSYASENNVGGPIPSLSINTAVCKYISSVDICYVKLRPNSQ